MWGTSSGVGTQSSGFETRTQRPIVQLLPQNVAVGCSTRLCNSSPGDIRPQLKTQGVEAAQEVPTLRRQGVVFSALVRRKGRTAMYAWLDVVKYVSPNSQQRTYADRCPEDHNAWYQA